MPASITTGNTPAAAAGASATKTTSSSSSSKSSPPQAFLDELDKMDVKQLSCLYYQLVLHQIIRTAGAVGIFLVLALLTPPMSTCLLPPCRVPSVVSTAVPLLVSFVVSAFVAVQGKVLEAAAGVVYECFVVVTHLTTPGGEAATWKERRVQLLGKVRRLRTQRPGEPGAKEGEAPAHIVVGANNA
jgi:hypothetical protein